MNATLDDTMTIAERIHLIQHQVADTARACQRDPREIHVLAVSKGQPASAIQAAFAAGVSDIGENYWQEAREKLKALKHLPLTWHYIGPLQSNKAKDIASHFDWVHSVEREKIARLLSQARSPEKPPLNVCIQINLDREDSKSGIEPAKAAGLIERINHLPGLRVRGFMAIPKPLADEEEQYASFRRLTMLLQEINQRLHLKMDTLSMGMSGDLKAAIRAGSTIVRIGRAIFGERPQTGNDE